MKIKLKNTVEHGRYIYYADKNYVVTNDLGGTLIYKDRKKSEETEKKLLKKIEKKSSKNNDKIN